MHAARGRSLTYCARICCVMRSLTGIYYSPRRQQELHLRWTVTLALSVALLRMTKLMPIDRQHRVQEPILMLPDWNEVILPLWSMGSAWLIHSINERRVFIVCADRGVMQLYRIK